MGENQDAFVMLAIRHGEVRGMCVIGNDQILRESVVEWAIDPTVTSMIRVPIDIARKSFDATEDAVRAMLAERSKP